MKRLLTLHKNVTYFQLICLLNVIERIFLLFCGYCWLGLRESMPICAFRLIESQKKNKLYVYIVAVLFSKALLYLNFYVSACHFDVSKIKIR